MPKNPKVKLGLENLALLPNYFDYIFVHQRQKARLRPELSPKFLSTSGSNPARSRPEKPGPTFNSASSSMSILFLFCPLVLLHILLSFLLFYFCSTF